jgi:hypothetical protein
MNYATWKLNFTDPNYGTGPEEAAFDLGVVAEGGFAGNDETILGYLSEPADEAELELWELTNMTQEEALAFCQSINPEAFLLPDGRITAPRNI